MNCKEGDLAVIIPWEGCYNGQRVMVLPESVGAFVTVEKRTEPFVELLLGQPAWVCHCNVAQKTRDDLGNFGISNIFDCPDAALKPIRGKPEETIEKAIKELANA